MQALNAIRKIEEGSTLFLLSDQEVSRMLVCGKCTNSAIDPQIAKTSTRIAIKSLVDKISNFDEWGYDPEISREKAKTRCRTYRVTNRDLVVEKREVKKADKRIAALLEKLTPKDQDQK